MNKPATKRKSDQNTDLTGKLPPQALELEEAVLGALMLERNAMEQVFFLRPEMFYKDAHQDIFSAIKKLYDRSEPIDLLTVTNQLRSNGTLDSVGGPYYVTQLTNRVASAANVEFHARVIEQKYIQRQLIIISTETLRQAYDETCDVYELAETSLQAIEKATDSESTQTLTFKEQVDETIKEIEAACANDGRPEVPTGLNELDHKMQMGNGDLVCVAARPGMGKTAFVLTVLTNAAKAGNPAALFSLEMSTPQNIKRLLASESAIDNERIQRGELNELDWQILNRAVDELYDLPIFIDDTPALSIAALKSKARRLKRKHNIKLLMVDYMQLMSGKEDKDGRNREQEISHISRSLKMLAKELKIPVIALSQLSRAVETRGGDKRPMLSDLRESGSIEQDCDTVMFIYRPEYYGFETDQEGNSLIGLAEIIVAKNRNGKLGTVKIKFNGPRQRFENLSIFDMMPVEGEPFA